MLVFRSHRNCDYFYYRKAIYLPFKLISLLEVKTKGMGPTRRFPVIPVGQSANVELSM